MKINKILKKKYNFCGMPTSGYIILAMTMIIIALINKPTITTTESIVQSPGCTNTCPSTWAQQPYPNCQCYHETITIGTCTDKIQNQAETGIDCGGPCLPCIAPKCSDSDSGNQVTTNPNSPCYGRTNFLGQTYEGCWSSGLTQATCNNAYEHHNGIWYGCEWESNSCQLTICGYD